MYQIQMVDLIFNTGPRTLAQFLDFLTAIQAANRHDAVDQLQASEWWHQVGGRGPMIAGRIMAG
jgi:hypothetical protein